MGPNKTLCGLGVGIGVGVLGSKGITLWFELSFDKGYIIQGISSHFVTRIFTSHDQPFNKRCLALWALEISVYYKRLHCHHFSFVQFGDAFIF